MNIKWERGGLASETAVLVGVATLVIGFVIVGLLNFYAAKCENIAAQMGVPHTWSVQTSCMIEVDGRWMPLDAYYYNPGQGQE